MTRAFAFTRNDRRFYIGMSMAIVVTVFVGFARTYYLRRYYLATISILDAAIVRWPLAIMAAGPRAFFAATDLFIVAGVAYDLVSHRRVHPAYVWGGLLIVVSQPLRLAIAGTGAWLAVARALAR